MELSPKLVDVIRRLYKDMTVKLQIGKEERDIPYGVGVLQGDNIAPVLFLFLLMAFAQTLEEFWDDIAIPEFVFDTEDGQLRKQKYNKQGRVARLILFSIRG